MTLNEIKTALAAVENGAEMVEALDKELQSLRSEAANYRVQKNRVLDALGIKDSTDTDSELTKAKAMLDALQRLNSTPDDLSQQIATLTAQVSELDSKSKLAEQKAIAEHDKRIEASKLSAVVKALTDGKAVNPPEIAKILVGNVTAKDDDSLSYNFNGQELSVNDGVQQYLTANQWAVSNTASSGSGQHGAKGEGYTLEDIKGMSVEEINNNWNNIKGGIK